MVIFAQNGRKSTLDEAKDTVRNIRHSGDFCVNIVSEALKDAMNISSGDHPAGTDEFLAAGLEKGQAQTVQAPYVKSAPAVLECKFWQEIQLPSENDVCRYWNSLWDTY